MGVPRNLVGERGGLYEGRRGSLTLRLGILPVFGATTVTRRNSNFIVAREEEEEEEEEQSEQMNGKTEETADARACVKQ